MSKAARGTAEARRYSRPVSYAEARPYDRALTGDLKDGEGDPATLTAVFNARRQWLDASAPEETTQEATADLRALARELEEFPGLRDFIYEALAWRFVAATRGDLLDITRRKLAKINRKLEIAQKEKNDVNRQLNEAKLQLTKVIRDRNSTHEEREKALAKVSDLQMQLDLAERGKEKAQIELVEAYKTLEAEREQRTGKATVGELSCEFGCTPQRVRQVRKQVRDRNKEQNKRPSEAEEAEEIRAYLRKNSRSTRGKNRLK